MRRSTGKTILQYCQPSQVGNMQAIVLTRLMDSWNMILPRKAQPHALPASGRTATFPRNMDTYSISRGSLPLAFFRSSP